MRMTSPYRGRRATKRLDLTDMRHLFRDERHWCAVGRTVIPEGEASHYEITETDVLVEVVLQPLLEPVTCRLAASMWLVPALGEEVVVTIPEGATEFMPVLIGLLSTGHVPTEQGPSPTRIVLERTEVIVHAGDGGAAALPTLASSQATIDKLNELIIAFNLALTATITPAPAVAGTEVLKAK